MPLQWTIIILSAGALQAIILSILLFKKKAFRAGYTYLIAYLLVLTLQMLFKISDKLWLMTHMTTAYTWSYYFPLLYGPLTWLFANNIFTKNRFQYNHLLHFLPFAAAVAINLGTVWFHAVIQVISLAVYHYHAFRVWRHHDHKQQNLFPRQHIIRFQWFRQFTYVSFFTSVSIALLIAFIYATFPTYSSLRFGFVLLTIFVYWVSYHALKQPALFTAIVNKKSKLSSFEAARVEQELTAAMEVKRLYTDPQLTIDTLAAELRTNRHILSQVLNQRLRQSFYDFINTYRISEAKRLLRLEENTHIKIASLAYDAGFNSLSVFNDVFKKQTGVTPSAFRKNDDITLPIRSIR